MKTPPSPEIVNWAGLRIVAALLAVYGYHHPVFEYLVDGFWLWLCHRYPGLRRSYVWWNAATVAVVIVGLDLTCHSVSLV